MEASKKNGVWPKDICICYPGSNIKLAWCGEHHVWFTTYAEHNVLYSSTLGELNEDMETSSETTTGPLDQTKDTCNLEAKQISEETGMAADASNTIKLK